MVIHSAVLLGNGIACAMNLKHFQVGFLGGKGKGKGFGFITDLKRIPALKWRGIRRIKILDWNS